MKRKRFGSGCNHCDIYPHSRHEPEGADREHAPVGLAENVESGVWQTVHYDAHLHAERLLFNEGGEMFDFRASECTSLL